MRKEESWVEEKKGGTAFSYCFLLCRSFLLHSLLTYLCWCRLLPPLFPYSFVTIMGFVWWKARILGYPCPLHTWGHDTREEKWERAGRGKDIRRWMGRLAPVAALSSSHPIFSDPHPRKDDETKNNCHRRTYKSSHDSSPSSIERRIERRKIEYVQATCTARRQLEKT